MAFDDLTDDQRELVTTLVEKLATGRFASRVSAHHRSGRGWIMALQGTGGAESEEIDGFTQTDLLALDEHGYVHLVLKGDSYTLSLTPRAYAEYKKMQENWKPSEVLTERREETVPVTFDEGQLEQIAATSRELLRDLRQNYDLSRSQASTWFKVTLGVSLSGFMLLAAGVGLTLASRVTPGILNTIAGIVGEFIALVFYRQATSANERQDDYHHDLIDRQKTLDAMQLAQLISDQSERDRIIESVIQDLLGIRSGTEVETAPSTAQSEQP